MGVSDFNKLEYPQIDAKKLRAANESCRTLLSSKILYFGDLLYLPGLYWMSWDGLMEARDGISSEPVGRMVMPFLQSTPAGYP